MMDSFIQAAGHLFIFAFFSDKITLNYELTNRLPICD